jgi:hypothetical protein
MNRSLKPLSLLPIVLLAGASVVGCMTSTGSGSLNEATQGCPEFQVGGNVNVSADVDVRVHGFMQACSDLGEVAKTAKGAVMTACSGIAKDLGAQDTWTALGDSDDAISNGNGTGACDAAKAKIQAIMTANANAGFALIVSRPPCVPDFKAEASCEASCQAQQTCDPGTVETRCDPGKLSVVCQNNCAAQGCCEGRADVKANCEGSCEAECDGQCSGMCTDDSGHQTMNDPSCHGKCSAHCSGTCSGRCTIDASAGVQCGANVTCEGGCTGSFTQPTCETVVNPPKCTIDATCLDSCQTMAVAHAVCDPPTVKLEADASVSADVAKLVATIDTNLPPLIQTAEREAHFASNLVANVSASGQAVLQAAGDLNGKSLACASAAGSSLQTTASALNVSTAAGAAVTQECGSHAN